MDTIQIVLIIGSLLAAGVCLLWISVARSKKKSHAHVEPKSQRAKQQVAKNPTATPRPDDDIKDAADYDIEHIFNTEFREELRNRGRLYFEKIINENAMFLQQDLRLTTSELNDYMKQEIKKTLTDEFSKYEESIVGAKDLAIASIEKTQAAIEEQRAILEGQLISQVDAEKARILSRFQENMTEIVNHYVLTAIGNEVDIADQLDYILMYLEDNKQAIVEDISHGA
ncbi:MAG: hypothetical protein AAF413_01205 [Patescibacteria group bacterium]